VPLSHAQRGRRAWDLGQFVYARCSDASFMRESERRPESRLPRHTPEVSALSRGLAARHHIGGAKPQPDSAPGWMNLATLVSHVSTRA